jgi:putative sugar O-methyltransferase
MNINGLSNLLDAYKKAPKEFFATSYWQSYEKDILDTISKIEIDDLRSGKYPILATFGFGDLIYLYRSYSPFWKNLILKFIHFLIQDRAVLPYDLSLSEIRAMAYHHCELVGKLTGSIPISDIEMSTVGNPADVFEIGGKKYSIQFLSYYIRYCFAHKNISLTGNEVIVELGSGSGMQIEVLKKLHPDLTVLCFDLPGQLFLCETYLSEVLGKENIVGTDTTLEWNDLSLVKKGHVHFFGNWQIPLIKNFEFDIFWNAASFGEMEPEIVKNYLSYIKGMAKWIYLLQATNGKEDVKDKSTFDDYDKMLTGYSLQDNQYAYQAHKRLSASGGYFEAVWKSN